MFPVVHRTELLCPKCRARISWPSTLTDAELGSLAALARSRPLDATRYAHETLGLDLTEAKIVSFHITRVHGLCHRCGSLLSGRESLCGTCRAANLDW
jgi:hypothetical protein